MKKVLSLLFVALLAASAWADSTVTFNASVDKCDGEVLYRHHFTIVKNFVTMYVGDGQLNTSDHYRIYGPSDTSALNFTSADAPIVKIEFNGLYGYAADHMSLSEGIGGTWTTSGNNGVWEGNAQFVYFDINLQARFTEIVVTLGAPINYPLGDVNHDGYVTIADVTALIDYLLSDANAAPEEADMNQDGFKTIADVTALIDYLLSGGNN